MQIHKHLEDEVIPALETSLEKYSEWWTLKDLSPLRDFIESLPDHCLETYFTPENLINLINDQTFCLNMKEPANADIINTANSPLQTCFKTGHLYAPDLYNLCLPHVNIVTHPTILENLQNTAIEQEIYFDTPCNLLYSDTTAQFWIPNELNQIICNNLKISYTWTELYQLFYHFFTTPSFHILHCDGNIYMINSNSLLASKIKFLRYHRDQITKIVQQLSRYLGKTSTILTVCPKITFPHCKVTDPFVSWLENELFGNNNMFSRSPGQLLFI